MEKDYKLLGEPVVKIIDGQKFVVRSFANANSNLTAEQIFLDILKRKVT